MVHEIDAARSTEWLMDHPELNGVFNCVAPNPVKNNELMRIIRKTYGMPVGLPAPKWLLEIGFAVIGTETELILKSRWVLPKKLLDSRFEFEYPEAEGAAKNILTT